MIDKILYPTDILEIASEADLTKLDLDYCYYYILIDCQMLEHIADMLPFIKTNFINVSIDSRGYIKFSDIKIIVENDAYINSVVSSAGWVYDEIAYLINKRYINYNANELNIIYRFLCSKTMLGYNGFSKLKAAVREALVM